MSIYNDIMALPVEIRAKVLEGLETYSARKLESEFCTMLDETAEGPVKIAGYEYEVSTALKAVDPVAFQCSFADWLSDGEIYSEIEAETYRSEDLETALEAYNDSLETEV